MAKKCHIGQFSEIISESDEIIPDSDEIIPNSDEIIPDSDEINSILVGIDRKSDENPMKARQKGVIYRAEDPFSRAEKYPIGQFREIIPDSDEINYILDGIDRKSDENPMKSRQKEVIYRAEDPFSIAEKYLIGQFREIISDSDEINYILDGIDRISGEINRKSVANPLETRKKTHTQVTKPSC